MTNISRTACSNLRNLLLCTAVTLGLAACGAGGDGSGSSSTASAAADQTASLVSPNAGTTSAASATTPSTSSSASTTPAAGTVAASNKSTTPAIASTGAATLDWMPPTENSDGSALTDLAGYTVYYGTSPSNLTQSVKVSNPGLSAYTVTDLSSGTWYFAVSAYSSTGVESSRTATISTTI